MLADLWQMMRFLGKSFGPAIVGAGCGATIAIIYHGTFGYTNASPGEYICGLPTLASAFAGFILGGLVGAVLSAIWIRKTGL